MREREAFQELDYRAVFGSIAKWATEIDDPARVPELVSRAFYAATSGRPGPVVMALPEDMLVERVAVPDAPAFEPVEIWPGASDMSRLQKLLWAAERPVVLLGGSRWSEAACASVARFAERFALPVATTFRRAHLFDPAHPCYAGDLGIGPNPKLLARVKGADLILLVGGRLGEMPSQSYTLLDIPGARQTLVHVFPGVEELAASTGRISPSTPRPPPSPPRSKACSRRMPGWQGEAAAAHADFAWTEQATAVRRGQSRRDHRGAARQASRRRGDLQRRRQFLHLGAPLLALPPLRQPARADLGLHGLRGAGRHRHEAPGAAAHSGRLAGDGDFLMTGQEFATAVQYDLPIIVVVVDNAMYGTIRMHQERHYPGRVIATGLKNPDFAAYARAFGGYGDRGEDRGFLPALRPHSNGQARDPASQGRSRGAHADHVAHRHPREGAQAERTWNPQASRVRDTTAVTSDRTDPADRAAQARPFRAERRLRGDRELSGVG